MKEVGIAFPNLNEVKVMSHASDSTPLDLAQQSADKDPTTMDPAQLAQIMEAAPLVKQFIEGVEAEVKRRLEAGLVVPGYKLVRGPGRRSWALPEEEVVAKLIKMKVPKESIYKAELVSPAQAEKLAWTKKGTDETVTLSEKQKKLLGEAITTTPGKMMVVPESDSRASVVTDASTLFSAVSAPSAPIDTPAPEVQLPAFLQPKV